MHATLIINPQAGNTSKLNPEEIMEALRQAGYDPFFSPTPTEQDLKEALAKAKDLVVVAGGDGSIRSAAIHLLGRNVRILPLPFGTANNICRMLGLNGRSLDVISGLADPVERDLDIWQVTTPHGTDYFVEAMGIGVFADVLEKYRPDEGKSLRRGIQTMVRTFNGYQPKFFHINVDGEDFSGSYLLCEVMNTPTVGFHFALAPDARPDDGLFDLVLIHAGPRASYVKFARAVLTGNLKNLPEVSVHRGRKLEIAWRGFPLHLDGTTIAGLDGVDITSNRSRHDEPELLDVAKPYINVELAAQSVHFTLPRAVVPVEKDVSAST